MRPERTRLVVSAYTVGYSPTVQYRYDVLHARLGQRALRCDSELYMSRRI